jgi:Calx-beta domain/FG-GAP-like repeat
MPGPSLHRRRAPVLVFALLVLLGMTAAASAAEAIHSCFGTIRDGYGQPVSGARVRFWLTVPGNPSSVLAHPDDVLTNVSGSAAVTASYDKATAVELHCKILPDGLPHKIKARENQVVYQPPAPFGQQVTVTAEMAPPWETSPDAMPSFAGEKTAAPDHGYGHARLYRSGAYDKVVIMPQGMDFFERTDDRATMDDFWFSFGSALKTFHQLGYDVWLFRPYLTGQNIHEQAAEFAQAIQHAAWYGPGPIGGKVIVAGYSLGALVSRVATARWEADGAWRARLGLEDDVPPAHLVAFMDGALRGANVSRSLQDQLWQNNGQVQTNLASCAAGQLLRDSTMCAGPGCSDNFFDTGQSFGFQDGNGTCDAHNPYPGLPYPCICDGGPAVSSLNGDGFPHHMEVVAFSAGTWNPGFNMCYGGVRDRNGEGRDVCPSDPGGDGPFAPSVGDHWWSVRCMSPLGTVLGSQQFSATQRDLEPGSRFTLAFEDDPHILHFLPHPWACSSLDSVQNFAFTFIPITSALAGDTEDESPFDAEHRQTASYQAVHNRPPDELFAWLIGKFEAAYVGCTDCEGDPGLPPAAPANVKADPVIGGWDQIDVSWDDVSTNEDWFDVQRLKSGEGETWHTIESVPAGTTTFRDSPVTGLRSPTTAEGTLFYFYRVYARNDHGRSPESNRADANLYSQAPDTPNTLRPRGCIDELLPTLHWDGGSRSSKYYVQLRAQLPDEEGMPDVEVTTPFVTPSLPLTPRRPYMLRVWGQNNVGWGTGSQPEFFRTFCEPVDPPEFLEPVGCIDDLTPVLKWTEVPGALSYHVRVEKVVDIDHDILVYDGGPIGNSVEIPAAQALEPGTDYRVKVKPHTAGTSDPYSRIRFFTTNCASAPGAGYVSPISPGEATTNRPEFLFEPSARADSYRLEVYETAGPLAYAREFASAEACSNGLCKVRPEVSLSVGWHAWRVRAGKGSVFEPYALFGWAHVPDLPSLSIGPAAGSESSGAISFTITLSSPATLPVRFSAHTENGTAAHPADFLALDGTWTIPAGATSLTVTVPVVDDAVNEATETMGLRLSSVTGALVANDSATGTIADDDPLPHFSVGSVVHPESYPDTWWVPIGLVGQSDRDVRVNYSVEGCTATTGVDFMPSTGEVRFAPGETEALVPFAVLDDAKAEGHEIVRVTLSGADGGAITENWAQATLVNDDPPNQGRLRSDFDGDGNNDLVWQDASGRLQLWRMLGVNKVGAAVPFNPPAPADAAWKFVATADFNADGAPDLVWRNVNSGQLSFWFMNGVDRTSERLVKGYDDLVWKLVGTGQFNADAWTDLVWRNTLTGEVKVWLMTGVKHTDASLPQPAAAGWSLGGVGDFDGNGQRDDLLWRNDTSGKIVIWLMDGVVRRESRILSPDKPADWPLVGILDIDANGTTDLVWQHDGPSQLAAWLLRGTTQTCPMYLTPRVSDGPGWTAVGPR